MGVSLGTARSYDDSEPVFTGPVKVVAMGGAIIAAGIVGWFVGFHHANDQLPQCLEDEVLVAEDFPYEHTADLECIRIDEVMP